MKTKHVIAGLLSVLSLSAILAPAAFADRDTVISINNSTASTYTSTFSTLLSPRFRYGRDVLILANDDIEAYRTTGVASDFLKEVAVRIAKLNQISETEVLLELKK